MVKRHRPTSNFHRAGIWYAPLWSYVDSRDISTDISTIKAKNSHSLGDCDEPTCTTLEELKDRARNLSNPMPLL